MTVHDDLATLSPDLHALQSKVRSFIYGKWGDAGDERVRPALAALDEMCKHLSRVEDELARLERERDEAHRRIEQADELLALYQDRDAERAEAAEAEVARLKGEWRQGYDDGYGECLVHLRAAEGEVARLLAEVARLRDGLRRIEQLADSPSWDDPVAGVGPIARALLADQDGAEERDITNPAFGI